MDKTFTFDDILLKPADFSEIKSRKDVEICEEMAGDAFKLPIVASNMDSVYSPKLSKELLKHGSTACVHRFCTIEENIKLFENGAVWPERPWVSIGVSDNEKERAEALYHENAEVFVIDVANGASVQVVEQFKWMKEKFKSNVKIVVGNFATSGQIRAFVYHSKFIPDLFKCNIGSGSVCTTRVMTGVGVPSVSTLFDCVKTGYPILHDGGIRNPGDFCKALALGAKGVMIGKLFAQCWESGAKEKSTFNEETKEITIKKIYRGSASFSSYETQGKELNELTDSEIKKDVLYSKMK
jgi:IMP dehydrogenase